MRCRLVTVAALSVATLAHAQASGGVDRSVPRFRGVTTVRAFAESDSSRVVTIATADIDRKSGPDLVTVQATGTLNGIYNNGRGGFANRYHNRTAVGLKPNVVYIEAADLNKDGYPDVVAMDTANSAFLVFLNNSDGTFGEARSIAAGADGGTKLSGGGLTIADANGDGNPDVITLLRSATPDSTKFSQQTFLGKGDGTFEPSSAVESSFPGGVHMAPGKGLSVADVNRDNKPDLVLQLDKGGIVVAVSPGAGDGTFQSFSIDEPLVRSGPQPASSLMLEDVNGDELLDAVFVNYSDGVYVAPGRTDASFGPAVTVASQLSGAVLIRLGDVNADGSADIIVFAAGEVGILAGKGDGSFQLTAQYVGGYGLFQQPTPMDFNKDGSLDIAALDYTNGRIGVYAGNGDGSFAATIPVHRGGPDGSKWAANLQVIRGADMNGDGAPDVLAYEWEHASASGRADLYTGLNDGSGNFTYRPALSAGKLRELGEKYNGFAIDASAADFNRDRRADVIYRTGAGLSVALAKEDGSLSESAFDVVFPVPVSCMPFSYVTTGDVNGDGNQDIVTGFVPNKNCGPSATTPSGFFVLLGDGQGHFQAQFTPFGEGIYFVRLADWDGDNTLDLAVGNGVPGRGIEVYIIPGKGDGSYDGGSARLVIGRGQFVSNVLAVDYNGDGRPDLVAPISGQVKPDGTSDPATAGVLLLPGTGELTFGEASKILGGVWSTWNGAGHGDFNGDGKEDLVFSTYGRAPALSEPFGVVVVPNEGNGRFGMPISELASLTVTGNNSMVFVGDFNLDGRSDILTGNGHAAQLFLNSTQDR